MADLPSTARRDLLLSIQDASQVHARPKPPPATAACPPLAPHHVFSASVQSKWAEAKAFEADAPTEWPVGKRNKFFGTFPYPYMNGVLHLGHAFSLSKLEFASAYHRLCGQSVLFPQGFHCTGMPIKVGQWRCLGVGPPAAGDAMSAPFATAAAASWSHAALLRPAGVRRQAGS